MNNKSKSIAQIAATLAGDPKVEKEVTMEVKASSLVSHLLGMRVAKGLSQEDIAAQMHCDPSKISRLESGNDLNLKWVDVARYSAAMGYGICLLFEDPSLPAAQRINEYVIRIHQDLEKLTQLAEKVGGNDEIAKKIHQFSGEVLLNFLIKYKDHSSKLQALVSVPQPMLSKAPPEETEEKETTCPSGEAVTA